MSSIYKSMAIVARSAAIAYIIYKIYHSDIKSKVQPKKPITTTISHEKARQVFASLALTAKKYAPQLFHNKSLQQGKLPPEEIYKQYVSFIEQLKSAVIDKYEITEDELKKADELYGEDPEIILQHRIIQDIGYLIKDGHIPGVEVPPGLKPKVIFDIREKMITNAFVFLRKVVELVADEYGSKSSVDILKELDKNEFLSNQFKTIRTEQEGKMLEEYITESGYTRKNYDDALRFYRYSDGFEQSLDSLYVRYYDEIELAITELLYESTPLPDSLTSELLTEINTIVLSKTIEHCTNALESICSDLNKSISEVKSLLSGGDSEVLKQFSQNYQKNVTKCREDILNEKNITIDEFKKALIKYRRDDKFKSEQEKIQNNTVKQIENFLTFN